MHLSKTVHLHHIGGVTGWGCEYECSVLSPPISYQSCEVYRCLLAEETEGDRERDRLCGWPSVRVTGSARRKQAEQHGVAAVVWDTIANPPTWTETYTAAVPERSRVVVKGEGALWCKVSLGLKSHGYIELSAMCLLGLTSMWMWTPLLTIHNGVSPNYCMIIFPYNYGCEHYVSPGWPLHTYIHTHTLYYFLSVIYFYFYVYYLNFGNMYIH